MASERSGRGVALLPGVLSGGRPPVLAVAAPRVPVVVRLDVEQLSVVEVVPELDIQAGAEDDAEYLEDGETEANGAQDYQVVLCRLQELVDAALWEQKNERVVRRCFVIGEKGWRGLGGIDFGSSLKRKREKRHRYRPVLVKLVL